MQEIQKKITKLKLKIEAKKSHKAEKYRKKIETLNLEFEELNQKRIKKKQAIDKSGTTLLLFYAYVEPEWNAQEYDEALKWAQEKAASYSITGRLRVAKEGFNGTMTGQYDNVRDWCQAMRDWKPDILGKTDFKLTDNLPIGQQFPTLKVFPVTELVNYGLQGKQPSLKNGGVHLEAKDFHKKMEEPNTVIIDVRNSYEAIIGHFQPPDTGAKYIDPEMRVSTEFPGWVEKNKQELKDKQIMMFCTGGIRCERASAFLREQGLDNIYQMKGGIHRYLEAYKDDGGYWKGQNYTFDKRFSHGAEKSEVMGNCQACKKVWNKYRGKRRCPACGVPLLICDDCQANEKDVVCHLCEKQGLLPKKKKVFVAPHKKDQSVEHKCGVCEESFQSRNAMFRHLKESGHMNRKAKKPRTE